MDFGILILIIFILAPLLDKLLKSGKPQPPPQQGAPPGRQRPPLPQERPQPRARPRAEADADDSAATVLPDDLWEILTGERRVPREPPPSAEPPWTPEPSRESRDVPARTAPDRSQQPVTTGTTARDRRLPPVELRRTRPPPPATPQRRLPSGGPPKSAADALVRRVPKHEAPAIVSRDLPIEDPELRRARFQERLAAMSTPERGGGPRGIHEHAFASEQELRRAIIAAEILGPPKGLQ